MKFIEKLEKIIEQYKDDTVERTNGTRLLGPGKIPKSRHMLFKPLTKEAINDELITQYKNKFPEQYIKILMYTNGASLYTVRLNTEKYCIAHNMLTIFGLPRNPPYSRPDGEEPYSLKVEDLGRHAEISKKWLKCARCTRNYVFGRTIEVFIDTESQKTFLVERNTNNILEAWNNLDDCLCSILDELINCEEEYAYKK